MGTRALQLLSLEQTMTITVKNCWQRLAVLVICTLIPGCLAAQTDATKSTNGATSAAPAVASNAGATAARAHDDTYVIGADDVLSTPRFPPAGSTAVPAHPGRGAIAIRVRRRRACRRRSRLPGRGRSRRAPAASHA